MSKNVVMVVSWLAVQKNDEGKIVNIKFGGEPIEGVDETTILNGVKHAREKEYPPPPDGQRYPGWDVRVLGGVISTERLLELAGTSTSKSRSDIFGDALKDSGIGDIFADAIKRAKNKNQGSSE